jgi:hypothetical protein
VRHRATHQFWRLYEALSESNRRSADKSFEILKSNPQHPSLRLKRIGRLWSARVNDDYRVLGLDHPDGIVWIWIGNHDDYERKIKGTP